MLFTKPPAEARGVRRGRHPSQGTQAAGRGIDLWSHGAGSRRDAQAPPEDAARRASETRVALLAGRPGEAPPSPGPPPIAASAAQPREDPTAEFTPRPETRPVRTRPEIPARERAAGAAHPGPPRASQELQRGARGTALRAVASRRKIFGGRELKMKFDPRTKWCSGHVA